MSRAHCTNRRWVTCVPSDTGTGLTHATGRGPLTPQAAAPYSYKLATVVRAPSGPRISVVAITVFDYGANFDSAVRKSDNNLLAHEFPHAKLRHITERLTAFEPRQGLCLSKLGLGRRCCESISDFRGFLTLTDGAGGFLPGMPAERLPRRGCLGMGSQRRLRWRVPSRDPEPSRPNAHCPNVALGNLRLELSVFSNDHHHKRRLPWRKKRKVDLRRM